MTTTTLPDTPNLHLDTPTYPHDLRPGYVVDVFSGPGRRPVFIGGGDDWRTDYPYDTAEDAAWAARQLLSDFIDAGHDPVHLVAVIESQLVDEFGNAMYEAEVTPVELGWLS
jgi:hypothetical protein